MSLPPAGTVLVLGDPVRLAQVAENLLANAVKYTEEGGRILVVDDEGDAANALVEILELEGHAARAVPDGESALAEVQTFDPELVLLDLGLPGMDGYEVARELRDRLGTRVAIFALTGYRDEQDRLRDAGFDGHLLKPTSLDELFAVIGELDRKGDRRS